MEQKKIKRIHRDSRPSVVSHMNQKVVSTLFSNRSQQTKSKLHVSKDSYLKEFKKTKIKLNTLSTLGGLNIEEQIKKEINDVDQTLSICQKTLEQEYISRNQKAEIIHLEQVIRFKDQTIKQLGKEIQSLKKSDRTPIDQESPTIANKGTQNSDKEQLFKLAEEIKHEREELIKIQENYKKKYQDYLRIKKLIEEIETKYFHKLDVRGKQDSYGLGQHLISYEEFKEKMKNKKEEIIPVKSKKIDFYHHIVPEKAGNHIPSRNMKDLITRKNITLTALKNSRKKHNMEMSQLLAKLDFLKDQDAHLAQKEKQKHDELAGMQRKFSERKTQNRNINRNPLLHFHS